MYDLRIVVGSVIPRKVGLKVPKNDNDTPEKGLIQVLVQLDLGSWRR